MLIVCVLDFAGIQGVASSEWYTFGANLATPTYLIPLMKSKEATSIETIAESILATVCDCFAKQKQFYIIGYSFGAIVAIQLAQMLERAGERGRVLLIDGSPAYLKKTFASMMTSSGTKEENVEDVLIMLLYFNMCNSDQTYDFIDQLQNCDKWSKKIDLLFRYLPEALKSTYSEPYLRNIFTAMSNRLKIVSKANPDDVTKIEKIKSPITLVRPTQASIADIANDYDLSKFAEQTVEVRYLKGNYLKMLNSDEVTQIIDKFAPAE